MSRFFDALKEASQSPRPANSGPAEEPLEAVTAKSEAHGLAAPVKDFPPPPATEPSATAAASSPATLVEPITPQHPESAPPPARKSGFNLDFLPPALRNLLPSENAASNQNHNFGSSATIILDKKARIIPHAADMAVVEHYRRLRTKILQLQAASPFRTLMLTSPNPQEGKTVTVLNLGYSFAMVPNFRILVVDGDLRRGSLGKWLGVSDHPGLSNLIEGSAKLEDTVLKSDGTTLQFMVRGTSKVAAAELLHSPNFASRLRSMTEHFDLILIDSPPVNLVSDTQELAGSCDAVLLIARAFATRRKSLEQALQDLSRFRIIGTVLNGGTRLQLYRRYNGYY